MIRDFYLRLLHILRAYTDATRRKYNAFGVLGYANVVLTIMPSYIWCYFAADGPKTKDKTKAVSPPRGNGAVRSPALRRV
ncbi:hypothetical protein GYMLUDRAFT_46761 [Collybiopsis luxurians FD-317 M1]|uniref:Unplaced genomic scaffold GYMLUscaffold_46, whole genome shotgun sequence n=1 Tax=Collybiopsis luxurians FD-317 M1 TaxID=944289 RepID=A0A0D0B194_9AGAR|nr:hypothetical protein GYMLUDRAFT_46761 [Collybiopsis luxurians FD-317 M1]